MPIQLSDEDRTDIVEGKVDSAAFKRLREKYDCSATELKACIDKERLLAAAKGAQSVDELRAVLLSLINKVF